MAECNETQSWLDSSLDCDYIDDELHRRHDREWQRIGGKLQRMIDRADTFCRPRT